MGTEGSGKRDNQKLKTYLILQYFLKNTDERHPAKMQDILLYLQEDCGIEAERRSIYRDIDDINKILYMLDHEDEGCTIQEAEEMILSSAERTSWFTLKTTVGKSLPAGAEITTFFAPASI